MRFVDTLRFPTLCDLIIDSGLVLLLLRLGDLTLAAIVHLLTAANALLAAAHLLLPAVAAVIIPQEKMIATAVTETTIDVTEIDPAVLTIEIER